MDPTTDARSPRRFLVPAVAIALGMLGILLLYLMLQLVTAGLDAEPPSRGDLPKLPAGLTVTEEETFCGSQSCAIEQHITGPAGTTQQDVAERLADLPLGCRDYAWHDGREFCVSLDLSRGDNVWLVVSLGSRY